jgi:cell division protein ZipA
MVAELRWILLALSVVLLAGIWWWGRRRSSQAPGNAALREITPTMEPLRPAPAADGPSEIEMDATPDQEPREGWGVPPFGPLSIRTQEYDRVPILDEPMMADPQHVPPPPRSAPLAAGMETLTAAADEAIVVGTAPAAEAPAAPAGSATAAAAPAAESGQGTPLAAPAPNSSERQKIVTIRVCAAGETRWSGASLLSALELHGLAYGRYRVFHRRHVDGRSLFCVASMIEPGTFDVAQMGSEEFRGITLFAVLPGPVEPLLTVDELLGAARGLAQELAGIVQDHQGLPLSPQRAAALRDDVARFQASLHRA